MSLTTLLRFHAADLYWSAQVTGTAGDPGQTSGPPERCYPPEPAEVESWEALSVLDEKTDTWHSVPDVLAQSELIDSAIRDAIDQAWADWLSDGGGEPPEPPEDYYA